MIEEQLKEMGYTDIKPIETSEGTGYVCWNSSRQSFIIPPNFENTDSLVVLVPGQGGTGISSYSMVFNEAVKNHNFPSSPVVLAPNDLYPYYNGIANPTDRGGDAALDNALSFLTENGADINRVGMGCFSLGGTGGMATFGSFLERHKSEGIEGVLFLCDTYNIEQNIEIYEADDAVLNERQAKIKDSLEFLKEHEIPIISLNYTADENSTHKNVVSAFTQTMFRLGFNFIFSESSVTQHDQYLTDFINGYGIDFLNGNGELNLNSDLYSPFYTYDENGNKVLADLLRINFSIISFVAEILSETEKKSEKHSPLPYKSSSNLLPEESSVLSNLENVEDKIRKLIVKELNNVLYMGKEYENLDSSLEEEASQLGVYIDKMLNNIQKKGNGEDE